MSEDTDIITLTTIGTRYFLHLLDLLLVLI